MSDNINVLKDMIDIRDGMNEYASLGVNDVNDIIDEICLNWIECIFKIFFSAFLGGNRDILFIIFRQI